MKHSSSSKKGDLIMSDKTKYKVLCVLNYMGILFLIPYLTTKPEERDDTLKMHINQGFALFLVIVFLTITQIFSGGILYTVVSLTLTCVSFVPLVMIICTILDKHICFNLPESCNILCK